MAIVNLRQASAHLGFRTTTTLRRLLQAGELSAYVRSGPDLRATYLDMAPKGRPTLRQHVQAHTECRENSPLWGADYESWPKPSGNWTDVANSYLDLPQWGSPPWTELQWATLRNVIELAEDAGQLESHRIEVPAAVADGVPRRLRESQLIQLEVGGSFALCGVDDANQ